MNDEFLHALRREPPPAFARRLKKTLQLQSAPRSRSFLDLRALIAVLLVGGSALAAVLFLGGDRSDQRQPQTRSIEQRRPSPWDRVEPGTPVTRGPERPVPQTGQRVRQPQHDRTPAASGTASMPPARGEAATIVTARGGIDPAITTGGGPAAKKTARLGIVASPLTEPLVRMVAAGLGKRVELSSNAQLEPDILIEEPATRFDRFCPGHVLRRSVDLIVTSRRITAAELEACRSNGASVFESKIGYLAVVLTGSPTGSQMKLSAQSVYLALARQVPDHQYEPWKFRGNPYVTWDQVERLAPARRIAVLGPRQNTLLRSTLETLVLETGCDVFPGIKEQRVVNPERHAEICRKVRDDRRYVEADQTTSLIAQRLWGDPDALAVLDYSFYDAHRADLGPSALAGAEPTYASLADGSYPFSKPVYVYMNVYDIERSVNISGRSNRAYLWDEFNVKAPGYLNGRGLVALDQRERITQQKQRETPLQPGFETTNPNKE